MKPDELRDAVSLAARIGHVTVATASASGVPHIATAAKLDHAGADSVALTEWFCPGTLANLDQNANVSIAVWDPAVDTGYQLQGRLEGVQDVMGLDHYAPDVERKPVPQFDIRLVVRVDRILDFTLRPHTDIEL